MKTNMIEIDRAIRIGGGLFLLATPILDLHTYPYNLLGAVFIATALVGFCPIYGAVSALLPKKRTPHERGSGKLAGSRSRRIAVRKPWAWLSPRRRRKIST